MIYIDYIELSEFLDIDELTAIYNFENAELKIDLRSETSFGRKYDNSSLKHSSRIF